VHRDYSARLMLLRQRSVGALLAAEIVSTTGSLMSTVALPWFVLVTTGSPARMGLTMGAELLANAIAGLPGGQLAAWLGARRTMLVSDLARAPLVGAIPLLHRLGLLSFPVLVLLVFALGCFFAPYLASQRTILPELLGEDERLLGQANALLGGAERLTIVLGPPLAGVLIAALGASPVLVVDAATFLVSFLLVLTFVPSAAPLGAEAGGLLTGLRALFRDRLLRAWLATSSAFELAWQALFAAIPVLAFMRYGDARVAGLLFACFGAGALAGNLLAFRLLGRLPGLLLAPLAKVPQAAAFWLLALGFSAPLVGGVLVVTGLCNGLINPPFMAVQTSRLPRGVRTQALTASLTVSLLAGGIGLALAGPALGRFGLHPVFVGIAAIHTLGGVVFVRAGLRARREALRAPLANGADEGLERAGVHG